MIKAIIIDFDDTLCLTEEACFILENRILKKMGRPAMSRKVHQATWGKPLFEIIKTRSPGIDTAKFEELFGDVMNDMVLASEIDAVPTKNIETLALLKDKHSLIILTSRRKMEFAHILDNANHELKSYIDSYYHRDNMKFHKPDPRAFEIIEVEHGWKPEECVYVGDSVGDADAALGAGLKCIISLESGLRTREDFTHHEVSAFVEDFAELPKALENI